ncbi:hypothetical protein HY213_00575 [Candidatus Peregrinibacteria bacterium]|nr:hypothetical protein [Candidatus Peregrinibacteria bacterium]
MSHQKLESIDTVRELIAKHPTEKHLKPAEIEKITLELAARKEALSSEDEQTLRRLRPAIDAHLEHLKTKTQDRTGEVDKLRTAFEALRTQLEQSWLGSIDVSKHLPEGGVKKALGKAENMMNENPGTTATIAIAAVGLGALLFKPVRNFFKRWWKWIVGLGAGWYFFGDKVKAQFAGEPVNKDKAAAAKEMEGKIKTIEEKYKHKEDIPLSDPDLEKQQIDLTKLTQRIVFSNGGKARFVSSPDHKQKFVELSHGKVYRLATQAEDYGNFEANLSEVLTNAKIVTIDNSKFLAAHADFALHSGVIGIGAAGKKKFGGIVDGTAYIEESVAGTILNTADKGSHPIHRFTIPLEYWIAPKDEAEKKKSGNDIKKDPNGNPLIRKRTLAIFEEVKKVA